MPEQALYLKWRPLAFEDVIGQEHVTRTLRNSLKTGRIRHAYLFSGPRGTGKTTTARLLAKAVNCVDPDPGTHPCNNCPNCDAVNEGRYMDLVEIDAATHTGVDDVRDLREKIAFTPGEGRYKVYIIDEVHRFTGNAFDALLKTLEEPPAHAIFVLATTEIDKVPATIKSRCLQFEFRRVSLNEVTDRLELIASNEGLNITRDALELIARQGTGSVRDSISLLDQMVSDPEEHISLETAQRILGTADTSAVKELVAAMVAQDIARGLHVINAAVDSGSDPRQFGQQVVEHLRAVMLAQTASADLVEASKEDRALFEVQAEEISRPALLRAVRAYNEAVNAYRGGWQPQLNLELALIEAVRGTEQEVVQVVQQVVAPVTTQAASTSPPPDEQTRTEADTDIPALVPLSTIREQWSEMLRALHRRNEAAPAVVQNFHPHRVEGNVVYIATDNEFFFGRLNGQADKLYVIEVAMQDTFQKPLRVQVMLINESDDNNSIRAEDIDDPVIQRGIELGGVVRRRTKQPGDAD